MRKAKPAKHEREIRVADLVFSVVGVKRVLKNIFGMPHLLFQSHYPRGEGGCVGGLKLKPSAIRKSHDVVVEVVKSLF